MDLLVVLTPQAFHRLAGKTPNITRLGEIDCRGVIATCRGGVGAKEPEQGQGQQQSRFDFVSRFFGPRCGIAEDPGTCALCVMWWVEVGHRRILIPALAHNPPKSFQSRAARTAAWPRTGQRSWVTRHCWRTRPPNGAGRCASSWTRRGAGCGWAARPCWSNMGCWGVDVLGVECWVGGV